MKIVEGQKLGMYTIYILFMYSISFLVNFGFYFIFYPNMIVFLLG